MNHALYCFCFSFCFSSYFSNLDAFLSLLICGCFHGFISFGQTFYGLFYFIQTYLADTCVHGMVYAAPMNEHHENALWATGRSPLLDSCHSWLNNIFTVKYKISHVRHQNGCNILSTTRLNSCMLSVFNAWRNSPFRVSVDSIILTFPASTG